MFHGVRSPRNHSITKFRFLWFESCVCSLRGGTMSLKPFPHDSTHLATTGRPLKLTIDCAITLLGQFNGPCLSILKPVKSHYGF